MNLKLMTQQVGNISRGVGKYIQDESLKVRQKDIQDKGVNSFVTYVDKNAERMLTDELTILLPGSGILAEEGIANREGKEFLWIIDPLDGTTNFIHNIPVYSISIALEYKTEIILGVVYEINRNELFYSWKDAPAYLNENEVCVSDASSLSDSLLATGFPYDKEEKMTSYIELYKCLLLESRGIRRMGSAAVDLAYVACGRFSAFYEYGLNPWDVAAGAFIVSQAGGMTTDFSGESNFNYGRQILASNGQVHGEVLRFIRELFA